MTRYRLYYTVPHSKERWSHGWRNWICHELGKAHPYLNLQLKLQLSDIMMAVLTESLRHSPPPRCAKTPEHRNYEIGHGEKAGQAQTPKFKPQNSCKKSKQGCSHTCNPSAVGAGTGGSLPLTGYRPCSRVSKETQWQVTRQRMVEQDTGSPPITSIHAYEPVIIHTLKYTTIPHKHTAYLQAKRESNTNIEVTNRLCFTLLNLVVKNTAVTCHPTQRKVFQRT